MSFATDTATHAYYEARAAEYDSWWAGTGLHAGRDRPCWHDEVAEVVDLVAGLPPARTLDVACGTGFLTRHLRGPVAAIDQSPNMVAIATARLPEGVALTADALALPFADGAFDRVFTGHFYGHLPEPERERFLAEARRVARELVVVDTAWRPGVPAQRWDPRVLEDGSRHQVYKRFMAPDELAGEIGGESLLAGTWFVAARATLGAPG